MEPNGIRGQSCVSNCPFQRPKEHHCDCSSPVQSSSSDGKKLRCRKCGQLIGREDEIKVAEHQQQKALRKDGVKYQKLRSNLNQMLPSLIKDNKKMGEQLDSLPTFDLEDRI